MKSFAGNKFCSVRRFGLFLLFLVLLPEFGRAQTTGSINGIIADASGAAIPGAKITVTEAQTNVSRTVISSDGGRHNIYSLRPTEYVIASEIPGFPALKRTGIVLRANGALTVNLTLTLGAVTDFVMVNAAVHQVDTTTSTLSQVVDSFRIVDLPLNGRNAATPVWRHRYNPIRQDIEQDYDVAFRFGQDETFPETTRNAYRWAWEVLEPPVKYVDLDWVRRTIIDVHSSQVRTIDGRAGIPYLPDARTGEFRNRSDAKRAAMEGCTTTAAAS